MKIVIAHPARFPVLGYGGTERAIVWLAKGLAERGHEVVLCGLPGSKNPYGDIFECDFSGDWDRRLPSADIRHFFFTPPLSLTTEPYVVTIEGNGKAGEHFLANTVFVSRNHADRHGGRYFVYNGIDLSEYPLVRTRSDHWIFLAKASWRVKNVAGAIRVVREAGEKLDVIGGAPWWLPPPLGIRFRKVRWRGMLGGHEKIRAMQGARGLIFPVLWHEPFGIAVIESLALGAPVVATPFGSLPELVGEGVGVVGKTYRELVDGVRRCGGIAPETCRAWVESRFTHRHMAQGYEVLYRQITGGEPLHPAPIVVQNDQGRIIHFEKR